MNVRTRGWIVAAVAAVALTTGCAAHHASPVAAGPPVTAASTGTPAPSGAPKPSQQTPTPAASTPAAAARGAGAHVNACTAADLDPRPIYEYDGGMGSAFQTVVVHNITHSACRLDSPVKLFYTDRHGTRHPVPAAGGPVPPASYIVPAGGYAEFGLRTVNGRPAGDACGREIDYTGLSVQLTGARFPLRGTSIDVTCPHVGSEGLNGVEVAGWGASIWPTPEGATITRAPAP